MFQVPLNQVTKVISTQLKRHPKLLFRLKLGFLPQFLFLSFRNSIVVISKLFIKINSSGEWFWLRIFCFHQLFHDFNIYFSILNFKFWEFFREREFSIKIMDWIQPHFWNGFHQWLSNALGNVIMYWFQNLALPSQRWNF